MTWMLLSFTGQAMASGPLRLPTVKLAPGMIIASSVRIEKGIYLHPPPSSLDSGVITVRGENITVDFQGATLEGVEPETDPDQCAGVAIRVDGGRNITILHAHIRGFKFGILARHTVNLQLIDNDISYNWKPRLFSEIEHESLVDWLSFHHNEKDEWLRYGGAIFLVDVESGLISGNRSVQNMNALMMTRCDHLKIENNNFSFNSGLGIGLYRSSHNNIIHNRLDYNVRGYSKFYHRGQDSADLLIFEQCFDNVVAYNSATHGGDGLFIWAGQTTMDSGNGGVNDNLFFRNDFSYSPANGMEATFSRNALVANIAEGCDYGVWGGYSYESEIVGNTFRHNRFGVAIEHGQKNVISNNLFDGDTTAISLWANPIEPSDWGYPKYRDTRSIGYTIDGNQFSRNRYGIKATNTDSLTAKGNTFSGVDTVSVLRDTLHVSFGMNTTSPRAKAPNLPRLPGAFSRLAPKVDRGMDRIPESAVSKMPRSAILVDEWGPFDYESPRLTPIDSSRAVPLRLRAVGPAGTWKIISMNGVESVSRKSGRVGDTLAVIPGDQGEWNISLEYRGDQTVSPRGIVTEKRAAVPFESKVFDPVIDWSERFFVWNDSTDPRTRSGRFDSLLRTNPIYSTQTSHLDFEWYRPLISALPQEKFAMEATGTLMLDSGTYSLRCISDDAARIWVDSTLVIDDWTPHGSTIDYASLTGGKHNLRVQYYQVDGWVEFRVDLLKGSTRSTGSP